MKLIIKEIMIAKCQNCALTQTFRVYKKGYTPETSVLMHNFDTSR